MKGPVTLKIQVSPFWMWLTATSHHLSRAALYVASLLHRLSEYSLKRMADSAKPYKRPSVLRLLVLGLFIGLIFILVSIFTGTAQ